MATASQKQTNGAPPPAPPETKLCSKCAQRPRVDPDGTNPWCTECKSDAARRYQENRIEMTESRGFAAGCSANKASVVRYFRAFTPGTTFTAGEIAAMVEKLRTPADAY